MDEEETQKCINCGQVLPFNKFKYQGINKYTLTCKDCLKLKKHKSEDYVHYNTVWDLDKLRQGFTDFFNEFGRFPMASEVDNYHNLPSARQIQRKWGGLRELRKVLNLDITDYSSGEYRSKTAFIHDKEAMVSEKEVREYLDSRYGEICVHEEKKYGEHGNTVDFFVYAKENFGVDVFKTSTYKNLINNVNIKLCKYRDYPFKLYFVVMNEEFEQVEIDKIINNKKAKLSENTKCLSFETFKKDCESIEPIFITFDYSKVNS